MNTLFAQKSQVETSKYERNSLSLHFLKFASGNSFSDQVLNSVKVSGKYDDNSLGSNVLTINVSEPGISAAPLPKGAKAVNKVDAEAASEFYGLLVKNIYDQKIPNKILAKILINDQKVSTPDVLSQRGEYNATDAQVLKANASSAKGEINFKFVFSYFAAFLYVKKYYCASTRKSCDQHLIFFN
jgi:hypothetical protein